jgi:hypothetical protein
MMPCRTTANFKRSGAVYLITTTYTKHSNRDIVTGSFRPINLQRPPFNFPEPLTIVNEQWYPSGGREADRSVALWKLEELDASSY